MGLKNNNKHSIISDETNESSDLKGVSLKI